MSKRTERQTWKHVMVGQPKDMKGVAQYIGNRSKYMPHQGKRECLRRQRQSLR